MKQVKQQFARRRRYQPTNDTAWAQAVISEPRKYPVLVTDLALRSLHRAGLPHSHPYAKCPLCVGAGR